MCIARRIREAKFARRLSLDLSDRLLRTEKLFAPRIFVGAARPHRTPFRQEIEQYLAPCPGGSSRKNFSIKRIVLRSFPRVTLGGRARGMFSFDAPGAETFAVSLVNTVVVTFGTTRCNVVCRGFGESYLPCHPSHLAR